MNMSSTTNHGAQMSSDPNNLPPLFTPKQAAAYLNIKASTLATWRTREPARVPFVKIGGAVRYRLKDLDSVIQRGLTTPEIEIEAH